MLIFLYLLNHLNLPTSITNTRHLNMFLDIKNYRKNGKLSLVFTENQPLLEFLPVVKVSF